MPHHQFREQRLTALTPVIFDGNALTDDKDENILTEDANTEMWLYQVPAVSGVDLSSGVEISLTNLAAGSFTQITNTPPSRLPQAGTTIALPRIALDNTDPSISDNGGVTAFVSNRNLVGTGNAAPENNKEIFTYVRSSSTTSQVTQTPRGEVFAPLLNTVPNISGNGSRVMFVSNADNPVVGMTGGNNADANEEVFYTDLDASGSPSGNRTQVSETSTDETTIIVNLVNFGRRFSRDGRFIAFDSFADLSNDNGGGNQVFFWQRIYMI